MVCPIMRCQLHAGNLENGFLRQHSLKNDNWKYNHLLNGICTYTEPRRDSNGQKPIHKKKTKSGLFLLLLQFWCLLPLREPGRRGPTNATT